jgi:flagellar basal body rod protein FlgG
VSARIVDTGDVFRDIIRRGTPVETDDGRLGFVRDPDFKIDTDGRMHLAGYRIQLTEGRGMLFKAPEKVKPVKVTRAGIGRAALAATPDRPDGAA